MEEPANAIAESEPLDPFATAENPEVPRAPESDASAQHAEADAEEDLAKTEVTDLAELEKLMNEQGSEESSLIELDGDAGDGEDDELPLLKTIAMAPELPTVTDAEQIPPTMVVEPLPKNSRNLRLTSRKSAPTRSTSSRPCVR